MTQILTQEQTVYSKLAIRPPMTYDELEDLTGIPRESLRRVMHQLHMKGLVFKRRDQKWTLTK